MNTTGQRIRRLRKDSQLTQKELGRIIGVSPATVTLWEKDETLPRGDNSARLVEALGTTWNFLRTGKEDGPQLVQQIGVYHALHNGSEETPGFFDNLTLPLYDREGAALSLKGIESQPIKKISTIAIPDEMRSVTIFAMIEDMDGLSPLINEGDRVFIKPELPIKQGTNSMFWVNGSPTIGMISQTPSGMMLRFISNSQGWEPVKVTPEDYIGRVIALDPKWAIEQREE